MPKKGRLAVLLIFNILFFEWADPFAGIWLLSSVCLTWGCALLVEKGADRTKRRLLIGACLSFQLILLAVFKYLPVWNEIINKTYGRGLQIVHLDVAAKFGLVAPIGISFYTLEAIGYLIDVSRGKYPAEKSFWRFAAFLSFFPNIMSGPIERGDHFLGQLREITEKKRRELLNYDRVMQGLIAMLLGYGMKLIVAQRAEILVNQVYSMYQDANSFTMLMLFAVVLTIGFYAGAPALLRLFGASDATLPYALSYSRLYILGSVFVLLVLGMNPFITTQGFAKTSMLTTVIGAVINIILDPILIFGFGLGVQGAAIATVLSQAVGAAWILQFLTGKKTILRLRKDYLRPEKQVILPVLALGISTFVMLSTESLLSISFSSSRARYGGDVAVGAMTVITSASQLCTLPIQGVCQGGQPVMSFNFGAGKKPRVKEAFRFQLTLCGAYTCLFWLAMMLAPGAVAGIFTSDSALISYTTWAMRIYMAGIFAMGFQIACQQSFMALGQAKVSLLLACLRKIILLIPLIFILPHLVAAPVFGVFLAEPVSDILAATITTITFFARFDRILEKGAARV